MAVKNYRPTSAGRRFVKTPTFEEVTKTEQQFVTRVAETVKSIESSISNATKMESQRKLLESNMIQTEPLTSHFSVMLMEKRDTF